LAIEAALDEPGWLESKFDSRVVFDPVFGCYLWTGPRDPSGYGKVSVALLPKATLVMAHRLAFAREYGMDKLPPGKRGNRRDDLVLDHTCFNHACVNPKHLRAIPTYLNIYIGKTRSFPKWEQHPS
jgi:hypothetical protein